MQNTGGGGQPAEQGRGGEEERLHGAFKTLGILGAMGEPRGVLSVFKRWRKMCTCIISLIMCLFTIHAYMQYVLQENRKEIHENHG